MYYGFVDKWLAEILEVPHEDYCTSNRQLVSMVTREDFDKVFNAIFKYLNEHIGNTLRIIAIVNSDVVGMKTMLYPFWFNLLDFDCITPGEVKASDQYLQIKSHEGSLDIEHFKNNIKSFFNLLLEIDENVVIFSPDHDGNTIINDILNMANDLRDGVEGINTLERHAVDENGVDRIIPETLEVIADCANDQIVENILNHNIPIPEVLIETPQLTPPPPPPTVNPIKDFINYKQSFFGYVDYEDTIISPHAHTIGHGLLLTSVGCEKIEEFAIKINKIIILIDKSSYNNEIVKYLRKDFKAYVHYDYLSKNCLFVFPNCNYLEQFSAFDFSASQSNNAELARVENIQERLVCMGCELSKLYIIKNDELNKFDFIYKDNITNVTWAARESNVVYILAKNNNLFNELLFTELSMRYNGKLSYQELLARDAELNKNMKNNDASGFIDFVIKNSQSVISSIKELYTKYKSEYDVYLSKAMESAKMMGMIGDQISSFDEESYGKKEKEKANKMFNDTMGIKKVSSVFIKDKAVHVYTRNLYCKDPRDNVWHDIGTFRISIGMFSNEYNVDSTVKVINTKHLIDGYEARMNAPHIFASGKICHGNMAFGMTEAYKRRDLFDMIMQLLIFIQSVNVDDPAGKLINRWPIVSGEVVMKGETEDDKGIINQISETEIKFDQMLDDAFGAVLATAC